MKPVLEEKKKKKRKKGEERKTKLGFKCFYSDIK